MTTDVILKRLVAFKKRPLRVFSSVMSWGSLSLLMVSEVERLSRELEDLRARVEALERRLVPVVDVSEEERCGLEGMRGEAEDGDYVPLDEVLGRYGRRRI